MLPRYLEAKLNALNEFDRKSIDKDNFLQVFQWLKFKYPSINYNYLLGLYKISYNVENVSVEKKQELIACYKKLPPSYPPLPSNVITHFLNLAKKQAGLASEQSEIPIGAIIVRGINDTIETKEADFEIIATGFNQTILTNDICAHAEIIALKKAAVQLKTHRLNNCDLYVTIEPCAMCIGAIMSSRIRRVIFGAIEPKTGAILSQYQLLSNLEVNHQTEAIGPINNTVYTKILKDFMQKRR